MVVASMRTRNLTLLLSDVKGYTERQSRSSRQEIEDELVRHRTLLQPIFEGFGGRVVKTMGDAFLVAFESPTDAVHAAVQVQKALDAQNAGVADPARATHVRVAISTGEVTEDEAGDVFGEPVNLAARLEGIAEAGTIYLTETTFLSMNRNEIPTLEVGHRVFKGIPDEVKVYRILDDYVARRHAIAARYDAALAGLPLSTPHQHPDSRSALHLYPIRLHATSQRRQVFEGLRAAGIGVNVHYIPVHTQPHYRRLGFRDGDFPEAENYYAGAISLPMFPTLTPVQQDEVIGVLKRLLG